ncbi:MAG: DUF2591 domain-containing protein [Comamonadaceae bacterium]|nr:MAG: DUF2591 domain-containing protein [Comamonadaceae bacterium]
MPPMKTAELQGSQLDFWVAKAEGLEPAQGRDFPSGDFTWQPTVGTARMAKDLRFSSDWSIGGLIVERARLNVTASGGPTRWVAWAGQGIATTYPGETALVAAMRAYVGRKFGDEVADFS